LKYSSAFPSFNLGKFDWSAILETLFRRQADNQRHTASEPANGHRPVGDHGLNNGLDLRRKSIRLALQEKV
jgi:hypothetical protein